MYDKYLGKGELPVFVQLGKETRAITRSHARLFLLLVIVVDVGGSISVFT